MAKKPKSATEITSIRHKKDTRVNIPTEELRDFVAEDEQAPKAMLYPRDPSPDPQLVWKGKDEQDAAALEVPVVPIYIQEYPGESASAGARREPARDGEGWREGARADAVRRLQRHGGCRVRQEGRFLSPRSALVEPDDPRRLAAGDDEPRREGRPEGQSPDDLFRSARNSNAPYAPRSTKARGPRYTVR